MPQISTLTLADGQSTPVNHDFVVDTIDGRVARWLEKTASSSNGWYPLSASLRPPTAGQKEKHSVFRLTLALPVVQTETVDGISRPVVVRTARANVELKLPETGDSDERADLVAFVVSALSHADIAAMITDLEAQY